MKKPENILCVFEDQDKNGAPLCDVTFKVKDLINHVEKCKMFFPKDSPNLGCSERLKQHGEALEKMDGVIILQSISVVTIVHFLMSVSLFSGFWKFKKRIAILNPMRVIEHRLDDRIVESLCSIKAFPSSKSLDLIAVCHTPREAVDWVLWKNKLRETR